MVLDENQGCWQRRMHFRGDIDEFGKNMDFQDRQHDDACRQDEVRQHEQHVVHCPASLRLGIAGQLPAGGQNFAQIPDAGACFEHDVDLRREKSWKLVQRFGQTAATGETERHQMKPHA